MPEQIIDAATGIVKCEHRKVAIIGAGPLRWSAPWDDRSWCFWALNEIRQPHYDRHLELHPRAVQSAQDLDALRHCPTPCYVLDPDEWDDGMIPYPVRYPLERILDVTGGRNYFTNTFAYETALAIADGFEAIGLWGVDLSLGTLRERLVEQPCLAYWVGFAQGKGITVTMPETTTLCWEQYLYGYDYDHEKAWVEKECDDAVMSLPKERWPALLQRIGNRYGGEREEKMVRLAAQMAQTKSKDWPFTSNEGETLDKIADAVTARRKTLGLSGTESAE